MERFPWHPRLRQGGGAKRLVVAAVTALTLAVVAAVGMAATSATKPNGCPTDKSTKPGPDRSTGTARAATLIEAFDVLSGPINEQSETFTLKVRIGSTCSRDVIGAERLRDRSALQPVHHPRRRAHRETTARRPWSSAVTRTSPRAIYSSSSPSSSVRRSPARIPLAAC